MDPIAPPKCAPKVTITLPVLQEINTFTHLQLEMAKVANVSCFSNPVMDVYCCNPSDENAQGKPDDQTFCAIHWICKVNLAARLGVGLPSGSTYDFEKSKSYSLKLTYPNLVKAIRAKFDGKELDADPLAASVQEAQAEDTKILEATAEVKPAKTVAKPKEAPSIASVSKPSAETKQPTAKPTNGYQPGSMGHFILTNLTDQENQLDAIWLLVEQKGWKSKPRFEKQIAQLVSDKLISQDGEKVVKL